MIDYDDWRYDRTTLLYTLVLPKLSLSDSLEIRLGVSITGRAIALEIETTRSEPKALFEGLGLSQDKKFLALEEDAGFIPYKYRKTLYVPR